MLLGLDFFMVRSMLLRTPLKVLPVRRDSAMRIAAMMADSVRFV